MTEQEIRDNKPDDTATHYAISNAGSTIHYCKKVKGKWHHWHKEHPYWGEFLFFMLDIKPL